MQVPPYRDHEFFESDWGSDEAAHAAAKALFEKRRAAKNETVIRDTKSDGVMTSETVFLLGFSKPANRSGSLRSRGWAVREPAQSDSKIRVKP